MCMEQSIMASKKYNSYILTSVPVPHSLVPRRLSAKPQPFKTTGTPVRRPLMETQPPTGPAKERGWAPGYMQSSEASKLWVKSTFSKEPTQLRPTDKLRLSSVALEWSNVQLWQRLEDSFNFQNQSSPATSKLLSKMSLGQSTMASRIYNFLAVQLLVHNWERENTISKLFPTFYLLSSPWQIVLSSVSSCLAAEWSFMSSYQSQYNLASVTLAAGALWCKT